MSLLQGKPKPTLNFLTIKHENKAEWKMTPLYSIFSCTDKR